MNKLFSCLSILAAAIALVFCFQAASALWSYSRFTLSAPAQILSLKTIDKSSSFYVAACFQFEVAGKKYEGETVFLKAPFPNEYAARGALGQLKEESWTAWHSSKDPSVNTLQKLFPFKTCIRAFLALSVAVYFFIMSSVAKRRLIF